MASQRGKGVTTASGDKENEPSASTLVQDTYSSLKRKASSSVPVVSWGPAPKLYVVSQTHLGKYHTHRGRMYRRFKMDPLVGHGRHFGRTIRTFCHVHVLITNGLTRTMQLELGRITEGGLSARFVLTAVSTSRGANHLRSVK